MDGTLQQRLRTAEADFRLTVGRMSALLQITELKMKIQRLEVLMGVQSSTPVNTVLMQLRAQAKDDYQTSNNNN